MKSAGCVITSYSIHYTKLYDVAARPEVFDAQVQRPTSEMTLVLRSSAPAAALAADARTAVAAVDPELAIYDVETMSYNFV